MSYRIVYEGKEHPVKHRKNLLLSLLICLTLFLCIYFGGKVFWDYEVSHTGEALENMVSSIVSGDKVTDAVTAFCQEILDNARNAQ